MAINPKRVENLSWLGVLPEHDGRDGSVGAAMEKIRAAIISASDPLI